MELFEKYYTYTLKYLSYRPRSEKELHDSLVRKKAPQEIIQKIITLLKEQEFLNDEDFARWWIEQRISFKPRSKRVLKMELKQKGISEEVITKYLIENEETAVNDLEQALRLTQKKIKRYEHLERDELYHKLGGALARKGFSWDVIKRAIDLTLSKER
jgi:regulatory protein